VGAEGEAVTRTPSSKRSQTVTDLDPRELVVLGAYEAGKLKSSASKADLQRMRNAARATAAKDRRVNIRLSAIDLLGIQARALEEGMPYQTLIASVLHKYVAGNLQEPKAGVGSTSRRTSTRAR
jgi:predicted DNA binding CopG/RHH family protein